MAAPQVPGEIDPATGLPYYAAPAPPLDASNPFVPAPALPPAEVPMIPWQTANDPAAAALSARPTSPGLPPAEVPMIPWQTPNDAAAAALVPQAPATATPTAGVAPAGSSPTTNTPDPRQLEYSPTTTGVIPRPKEKPAGTGKPPPGKEVQFGETIKEGAASAAEIEQQKQEADRLKFAEQGLAPIDVEKLVEAGSEQRKHTERATKYLEQSIAKRTKLVENERIADEQLQAMNRELQELPEGKVNGLFTQEDFMGSLAAHLSGFARIAQSIGDPQAAERGLDQLINYEVTRQKERRQVLEGKFERSRNLYDHSFARLKNEAAATEATKALMYEQLALKLEEIKSRVESPQAALMIEQLQANAALKGGESKAAFANAYGDHRQLEQQQKEVVAPGTPVATVKEMLGAERAIEAADQAQGVRARQAGELQQTQGADRAQAIAHGAPVPTEPTQLEPAVADVIGGAPAGPPELKNLTSEQRLQVLRGMTDEETARYESGEEDPNNIVREAQLRQFEARKKARQTTTSQEKPGAFKAPLPAGSKAEDVAKLSNPQRLELIRRMTDEENARYEDPSIGKAGANALLAAVNNRLAQPSPTQPKPAAPRPGAPAQPKPSAAPKAPPPAPEQSDQLEPGLRPLAERYGIKFGGKKSDGVSEWREASDGQRLLRVRVPGRPFAANLYMDQQDTFDTAADGALYAATKGGEPVGKRLVGRAINLEMMSNIEALHKQFEDPVFSRLPFSDQKAAIESRMSRLLTQVKTSEQLGALDAGAERIGNQAISATTPSGQREKLNTLLQMARVKNSHIEGGLQRVFAFDENNAPARWAPLSAPEWAGVTHRGMVPADARNP